MKKFQYTNSSSGHYNEALAYEASDFVSSGPSPNSPVLTNSLGFIDSSLLPGSSSSGIGFNRYFTANAVAASTSVDITTQIISESGYTLQGIDVGGDNRGTFTVLLNGSPIALRRTNYLDFCGLLEFGNLPLAISDVLIVSVTNRGSSNGNFEARLIGFHT